MNQHDDGQNNPTHIDTLYAADPIAADRQLWGRETSALSRRGFLKKSGLVAMSTAIGAAIPFARFMPSGLIPAAFAAEGSSTRIEGKEGLIVLNERPLNAETPAHLLDDSVTPSKYMFVRNNGVPPEAIDVDNWTLEIAGESCVNPLSFSIAELKQRFEEVTLQLQLECGGNGRSEFVPATSGNQWTTGAIGCPTFTGVRLRDVLNYCGVGADAEYVGYYGADTHLSGDSGREPISRGVPIAKALERESLIAWKMNGEDLPLQNGYPLRLVCAGWPASVSGKWLKKLVVRNQVHDGEKMAAPSYSVPKQPVAPGSRVPNEDMKVIESMPVKSLITFPKSGITHDLRERLIVRGHAWAGDDQVSGVYLSIDFGATWLPTGVNSPANRLAWQDFSGWIQFPQPGYYEIWARAMDMQGRSQPLVIPGWNPRGYLNNTAHRIAVQVV
ncbi:MAG TPA: molybdopterin containing oxidoreductase [Gammaproteobacteria bacterium]|jgi:DMSO/TMAO reductase YedYZ molybdopterin-dependent catalytic subunit|nr:molybdopterin containing oxidoreductase [Gammaproteobacteria bacterium]